MEIDALVMIGQTHMVGYYWNSAVIIIILKLPMGKPLEIGYAPYTCFNRLGASVVDYLLVENPICQKVENWKILPPEFDSKHTPITATFRIKTINNSIRKPLSNCKDSKMKIKTISEALERSKSIQNL